MSDAMTEPEQVAKAFRADFYRRVIEDDPGEYELSSFGEPGLSESDIDRLANFAEAAYLDATHREAASSAPTEGEG